MYRIESNHCSCHPETCNCNDYIITKDGKKLVSVYAITDEVKQLVDDANNTSNRIQPEVIASEQQSVSANGAVAEAIEKCASICGRPFYRLAPSMIEINPESHEPVNPLISQRDLFSFVNDVIKLRAEEIRKMTATASL